MNFDGFYMGQEYQAYEYLGAQYDGKSVTFRVYAPHAAAISVIGDFRDWKGLPMQRVFGTGFWEVKTDEAKPGSKYKYQIKGADGQTLDHCDPYGFQMELRPNSASIVYDKGFFNFEDEEWMKNRSAGYDRPVNIYELHAGSWKKPSEKEDAWYTYDELADLLIPYLKEMGYNYVEMLPLSEYPSDQSWGYQQTGFYAPTARYGTPDQMKQMVRKLHAAGIGLILDFVPVHFAMDSYGLKWFDGTALYESKYQQDAYSEWGTCNFDYSKGEVRSFMQSCANYWLSEFHCDGLRMDAISNMVYWHGNMHRGENPYAVRFLANMNEELKRRHASAMLIAEDSTAREAITRPMWQGGLGFDYKWDMGWMNDTLDYFKTHPYSRGSKYHKLSFSMMYFYSERFTMTFSHDENVHGKATILQKMWGDYDNKFAQGRALYAYMYTHPGKKLNFMGNEFGQLREWDERKEQDWFMLKYPIHDAFHKFIRDLNQLYLAEPALWEKDFDGAGFEWRDVQSTDKSVYAYERKSSKEQILCVFNFSDLTHKDYKLCIPDGKSLKLLLDSDQDIYGGATPSSEEQSDLLLDKEYAVMTLPPFSARCYKITRFTEAEKRERIRLAEEEKKAARKALEAARLNTGAVQKAAAPKKTAAKKETAPKKETAAKKAAAPKKETTAKKAAAPKKTAAKKETVPKKETAAKKTTSRKKSAPEE